MKKERPVLLDLEYVHPCWCISAVEKVEGSRIMLVSQLIFHKGAEEGLFEIDSQDDVSNVLKAISKSPHVTRLQVIHKTKNWALANIVFKHDSLVISKFAQAKSILLPPTLTKVDRDYATVVVPSERQLRELASLLKESVDFKVRSKKYLDSMAPSSLFNSPEFLKFRLVSQHLPEKQKEAFILAVKKGYYDTPKKTTIEDLAGALDVSPSTLAEHLRKAEGRLLVNLGNVLELLPDRKPR